MKVNLSTKEYLNLSIINISNAIEILDKKEFSELNNAVLNILKSIVQELFRLIDSMDELEYANLHTRNIFELYLILSHIYSDADALVAWYGQIHKDSEQVINGFRNLLMKKSLDTFSLDAMKRFQDEALGKSPYSSTGNFNISALAKSHGYQDDYDFVYKLTSKLVHPSSMKVNLYSVFMENDNYLNVIITIALNFGQKADELAFRICSELS
ncbi:DUF5677 domain-containing protein [Nitrosomonas ureae]|uniref:Uncharacterized protein n=1 Tax=Nitrosomonas ureae TaxID=44577 RepID=A0A286AAT8_9PROT|nr:DUF5677 domain-containing protein [Nitrosomonas ureae]SOD19020.1 hypothetical protein SAMN06297164_1974 [Nitrosomonas ureae]